MAAQDWLDATGLQINRPLAQLALREQETPASGARDASAYARMAAMIAHAEEEKQERLPLLALANYSLAGQKKDQHA